MFSNRLPRAGSAMVEDTIVLIKHTIFRHRSGQLAVQTQVYGNDAMISKMLTMKNMDKTQEYECIAKNVEGKTSETVTAIVTGSQISTSNINIFEFIRTRFRSRKYSRSTI
jgi:hypothetical protein